MQALRRLVDENNVLARELKHRVRNNLQLILAMLDRHAATLDDGPPKQGIETITLRLMTMARMYDSLLGNGMDRMTDFGDYLRSLCASLTCFQAAKDRQVELICIAEHLDLHIDIATALGMAVAELVTNSYGHGFPNGRTGTITVSLSRSGPGGEATLTVKDNGVGFEATAASKGYGLKLTRQLMEKVNVSGDLQSDGGTTWTLTFATSS